jgi:hypothetical protein
MRKILIAVAIISSLVIASTASAAQSQANGARKGPVAKLIELEKRKNEWLRDTFLNNKQNQQLNRVR